MNEKVVILGAGSAMFTRGLVTDLIRSGWNAELALVDTDAEALEVADELTRKMLAAQQAPVKLTASINRRDVLRGATVVISTIGVGGRRAWEQDVFIPRKHGLNYAVGDTTGPGGTSRAYRMIPAMIAIAEDVLRFAPNALFFNYANPMSAICRAVRKVTGANIIGLCHGVHHVGEIFLPDALGLPRGSLQYTAIGINHLTWFTEIRHEDRDLLPRMREMGAQRVAQLRPSDELGTKFAEAGTAEDEDQDQAQGKDNPFSWHLCNLFGAFPAVFDRHVSEFFPQFFRDGRYYGRTLGVDAYSLEKVIGWGDKLYGEMRKAALSPDPLPKDYFDRSSGEHEQALDIVESIRTESARVYSANLPNTGQVPNLPRESVIECPAIADGSGLRALQQPPLPSALVGTLATRFQWVETIVEAALERSREKFIQALVLDGAVTSLDLAVKLADELLAANEPYLKSEL